MTPFDTCALCPRLCRDACPVATGSARESAVPANIAHVLRAWKRGAVPDDLARDVVTQCVDCGGCHDACHLHQPLPDELRAVRVALVRPPAPDAPGPIEGDEDLVVVEADDRPLADLVARRRGVPVARWRTADGFGVDAIEGPAWTDHARRLRDRVGSRSVVVADGGAARALARAGVAVQRAHEVLGETTADCVGSCVFGGDRPLACCGAAAPLGWAHPDDAARVGRTFGARADHPRLADARCRNHLRRAGVDAVDLVDRWLEGA